LHSRCRIRQPVCQERNGAFGIAIEVDQDKKRLELRGLVVRRDLLPNVALSSLPVDRTEREISLEGDAGEDRLVDRPLNDR
jgi:hypothetical protein